MKAVILAGGDDTRLRPLTHGISKLLLPVAGKPLIDYAIDNVLKCKMVDEVLIATSHMGHHESAVRNYLENTRDGIDYRIIPTLGWGSGGDLKLVTTECNLKEPVVVAYGDIVTDLNVNNLVSFHNGDSLGSLALFEVPNKDVSKFGMVVFDGQKVLKFVEKPSVADTPSNIAHTGYFVLDPKALDQIALSKFSLEKEGFPKWAEQGKLKGIRTAPSMWIDIGSVHSYMKANRMAEIILPPE